MNLPRIEDTPHGQQAVGASAPLLEKLLGELERVIISKGIPVDEWLKPGLDSETISNMLAEHCLGAPEEIIALYGWHNGFASNRGARTIPRFPFNSLEISIQNAEMRTLVVDQIVAQSGGDGHDAD